MRGKSALSPSPQLTDCIVSQTAILRSTLGKTSWPRFRKNIKQPAPPLLAEDFCFLFIDWKRKKPQTKRSNYAAGVAVRRNRPIGYKPSSQTLPAGERNSFRFLASKKEMSHRDACIPARQCAPPKKCQEAERKNAHHKRRHEMTDQPRRMASHGF